MFSKALVVRLSFCVGAMVVLSSSQAASYQQQVHATHPAVAATGQNAVVVQVEVPSASVDGTSSIFHYAPNAANANFRNVTLHIDPSAKASSHGNTVAQLFFGQRRSIALGISHAYVISSHQWLRRLLQWDLKPTTIMPVFPGPVVNHSWVGGKPTSQSGQYLRRVDYSALSNNVLHVVGVRRSGSGEPLLAGGYNTIAVGGSVKNIETPFQKVDSFYADGRVRPHLIGPYPHSRCCCTYSRSCCC